jgi:hypothetical protein
MKRPHDTLRTDVQRKVCHICLPDVKAEAAQVA